MMLMGGEGGCDGWVSLATGVEFSPTANKLILYPHRCLHQLLLQHFFDHAAKFSACLAHVLQVTFILICTEFCQLSPLFSTEDRKADFTVDL